MKLCNKRANLFKSKVRKKLKAQNKELKARLEYAERLNKENNKLVEENKKCIDNMQATINQRDKELNHSKKNMAVANVIAQKLEEQIDGEKQRFEKIIRFFECTEEEKKQLKQDLSICNNRIKYEFQGE